MDRYEKGSKLSGVIYVHRISDKRFTGVAGRNFRMVRELCGDAALKNIVLVTNMWSEVPPEVGENRERQLSGKFFKPVLDLGAQMARHQNTVQSAHDIIRKMVANDPVVLQIQRELVDEHKDITNTTAGEAVNQELHEQIRRHQTELEGIEEEMEQVLKEKDEQSMRELEEERRKVVEQMERIKKDSERMALKYAAEKERMKVKIAEIERRADEERGRAEAGYHQQSANPDHHLQDTANTFADDRPMLEQEAERQQDRLDDLDDSGSAAILADK